MTKVFSFDVFALLDPGAIIYFITQYIAMRFHIFPKRTSWSFHCFDNGHDYILAERLYLSCTIFINHKNTMVYFVKLEMMDFDVILCME